MIKIRTLLLFFAFFEGFCVMAVGLFSAKLIAPYFGGSLYVWASVLGITLLSLMIGYYSGGLIPEILPTPGNENHRKLIFIAQKEKIDLSGCNYQLPDLPILQIFKKP